MLTVMVACWKRQKSWRITSLTTSRAEMQSCLRGRSREVGKIEIQTQLAVSVSDNLAVWTKTGTSVELPRELELL